MRELYEGSIAVDGSDYVEHDEEGEEVAIGGLDERVTTLPVLHFTLDYPFDQPYRGEVITDAGASLRQIIDAVRAAYRLMYRGSTAQDHPTLDNKIVDGEYGRAYHAIGDLVIEAINLDEATGELEIVIGS